MKRFVRLFPEKFWIKSIFEKFQGTQSAIDGIDVPGISLDSNYQFVGSGCHIRSGQPIIVRNYAQPSNTFVHINSVWEGIIIIISFYVYIPWLVEP